MTPSLQALGLMYSYRSGWSLGPIDFVAPRGSVTALIGPNGAGKTTLLRILAGLLRPRTGACWLDGAQVADRWELTRRVAFAPTEPAFPGETSVGRLLRFRGRVLGLSERELAQAEHELENTLGRALSSPPSALSRGQRVRCSVALALLGSPEFVLVDEPWSGLDPLATDDVLDKLKERSRSGAAVVVSSHDLYHLPQISDQFVFLVGGHVRIAGSLGELRLRAGGPEADAPLVLKLLYERFISEDSQ